MTASEDKKMLEQASELFSWTEKILYEVSSRKHPESRWPGFEKAPIKYNEIMRNYCARW